MIRDRIVLILVALACAGRAAAFEDYTGRWGGTTSFYGQFSPSWTQMRDGVASGGALVDNTHSNSRFGAILRHRMRKAEFRFRFETSLGIRQSDAVSQTFVDHLFDWNRSDIRFVDFIFDHGGGGVFSVGHGSMATDQVASADLSGTTLVNGVSVSDMAGDFQFRTAAGALSGITVNSAYETFDGVRRARMRLDRDVLRSLPGQVTLSLSAGTEVLKKNNDETNVDIALTYVGAPGEFRIEGAVGVSLTLIGNRPTRQDRVGSISILHRPSGLSLTVAAGAGNDDANLAYGKIGYQADLFAVGTTAMSVDIYEGRNFTSPGSRSRAWGVGIVQNIVNPDIELYLGFRRYALSDSIAAGYLPIRAIQFGTRWQF